MSGLPALPREATVCPEGGPGPRRAAATGEPDCLSKCRRRIFVYPLAVTNEHVLGLNGEQPPRWGEPQQWRDAKPLSRRAVVLSGADRVGAEECPLLGVPERNLVPPASAQ